MEIPIMNAKIWETGGKSGKGSKVITIPRQLFDSNIIKVTDQVDVLLKIKSSKKVKKGVRSR